MALLFALSAPAFAAERSFTVTSFDRIRVDGPYSVVMTSGKSPSARAGGSPRALDTVSVRVEGRTLVVRRDTAAWGGYPGQDPGPVTIAVSGPEIVAAWLNGAGSLAIDRMRGASLQLSVQGSGQLELGRVEADRLALAVNGSGVMTIAGKAAEVRVAARGTGGLAGAGLVAVDAEIMAEGAGDVALGVARAVKVTATGTTRVKIAGDPACTVNALGSATVECGR